MSLEKTTLRFKESLDKAGSFISTLIKDEHLTFGEVLIIRDLRQTFNLICELYDKYTRLKEEGPKDELSQCVGCLRDNIKKFSGHIEEMEKFLNKERWDIISDIANLMKRYADIS